MKMFKIKLFFFLKIYIKVLDKKKIQSSTRSVGITYYP